MRGLRVAKIVKGMVFERVWGELELGGGFLGQSVMGYLGLIALFGTSLQVLTKFSFWHRRVLSFKSFGNLYMPCL